jgi:hypothetical protein
LKIFAILKKKDFHSHSIGWKFPHEFAKTTVIVIKKFFQSILENLIPKWTKNETEMYQPGGVWMQS